MTSPHGTVAAAARTPAAEPENGAIIRHSARLLTGWLALLLLWAPLPFGGVTPWATALLQGVAFVALVLAGWSVERPRDLRPAVGPAAALAAIALLGLLQSLPWPAGLMGLLSPGHAEIWRQAAELPGASAPAAGSLTFAPASSRAAALTWVAAACALLAGAAAGRRRDRRRWLLAALCAGALFQIFFGAQQWFAKTRTLWGVEIPASPRLHGTFVNPNHLALYLEMALPAAFAWIWWASRQARMEAQPERKLLLLAPPALLWLTLFLGLAFTGSRGGLLGAVVGVSVQALTAAAVRRRWRTALLGLGAVAAGLVVVAAVGLREGLGRVLTTTMDDVSWAFRLREYAAVIDLWRRFPLFGSGLGAFRDAFPQVQPPDLQGSWWHAHSDLLELLATAGAVGMALVLAGLWPVPRRLLRVIAGRGRSENRAAALAVFGALVSVLIHEALDFGLTMPGNALTFAVLVGAGLTVPIELPPPPVPARASAASEGGPLQEAPASLPPSRARRHAKRKGGRR
jgi:O-antigen ligase